MIRAEESYNRKYDRLYNVAQHLWAVAIMFSFFSARFVHAKFSIEYLFADVLPLFFSALFLVLSNRKWTLYSLGISFLISCFLNFPLMPNHRYVLLASTLVLIVPQFKNDQEKYFQEKTLPTLRLLLSIVYLFAFFVKLNSDYLDDSRSCASLFYHHIKSLNSFLPENASTHALGIYGSIIIEILLPVLFYSRLSRLGTFLGIGFHFILALDIYKYFTNFSAVMTLLLVCAGGKDSLYLISKWSTEALLRVFKSRRNFSLSFIIFFLITNYFSYSYDLQTGSLEQSVYINSFLSLRHAMWYFYSLLMLTWAAKILWCDGIFDKSVVDSGSSLKLGRMELLIIFLVIFNGLTPFLGIKTRTGFNMYSNLRIEPAFSNHLIVKGSPDLGGFLSDTAIVGGDAEAMYCNGVLYGQTQYPIFEILRASTKCPKDAFEFEYKGIKYVSNSNEAGDLVSQKTSWLSRKLLTFKPMGLKAETECIW